MALLTAAGVVIVATGLGAWYGRRRLSSHWIDLRSSDDTDLSGQTIVITGGNVGLGYEAALDYCRRRAHVVLGCRDRAKGERAVQAIREATADTTGGSVECLELDLASLTSVRQFASEVQKTYKHIDALVLNAGVWYPMELNQKTPRGGYEIHFFVNHLAHLELARCLKDHMAASKKESRIVFVTSGLAKEGKLDFETQDFVKQGREAGENDAGFAPTGYCDSKLMNILTCQHLATLLPPNVTTYAICPGFCRSSLARNTNFSATQKVFLAPMLRFFQRSSEMGAQNIVFGVVTPTRNLQSGAVYSDGSIEEKVTQQAASLGSSAPQKLWDLSLSVIKEASTS